MHTAVDVANSVEDHVPALHRIQTSCDEEETEEDHDPVPVMLRGKRPSQIVFLVGRKIGLIENKMQRVLAMIKCKFML